MRLAELPLGDLSPSLASIEITGLAYDSREVRPGTLFFCVSGYRSDGHDFAAAAIAAGAVALVVERPLGLGVPEVLIGSARDAMGPVAAAFHHDPSAELRVLGVTGTNGKTTTAFLLAAMLRAAGEQCGLLGTVKSIVGGAELPVARTTPEAIDLQATLRAMLDGGDRACAMEVSSHALRLGRTAAVHFAAAIFTNLTQDHLDFHDTMEDYFAAKRRLFIPGEGGLTPRVNVINLDDPYGRRLAAEIPGAVTFAIDHDAHYRAQNVQMERDGWRLDLQIGERLYPVRLGLPGRFNLANALGALAAAHSLGCDLPRLIASLDHGVRVPGRFEPVIEGQDFTVIVDYAHTPDSLANVLRSARELTGTGGPGQGRVLCVFGAGGDRDRGKRPLMGEIAARAADLLVVTSDNPRSEDPESIIEEIMIGMRRVTPAAGAPPAQSIVDRRAAIECVIEAAQAHDVVVIAGKGHEQGQELADGVKVAFDDVSVAREALRARGWSRAEASE
jgi:UDP-N-acetylmuramoyl-L-alanyl-D-glutamate--2,6-diaminopimelate ligase